MYQQFKELYGLNSSTLVWQAATELMNPTISKETIKDATQSDPSSALSEWGAEFREDLEAFLPLSLIESVLDPGRLSLPPWLHGDIRYFAFCDPSGGRQDSMTLAISHADKKTGKIVLDNLQEVRPPFEPDSVCSQFAQTLKSYGLETVTGDRYSGEWIVSAFRNHGILYQTSELNKSEVYLSFLPLMSNHSIELLDNKRLVSQLRGLERRTRSGGNDSVDHAPGCHDDIANSACGAVVKCWSEGNVERLPPLSFGIMQPPSLSSDEELERYARKWLLDDRKPKQKEGRLGRELDEDGNVIEDDDDEF